MLRLTIYGVTGNTNISFAGASFVFGVFFAWCTKMSLKTDFPLSSQKPWTSYVVPECHVMAPAPEINAPVVPSTCPKGNFMGQHPHLRGLPFGSAARGRITVTELLWEPGGWFYFVIWLLQTSPSSTRYMDFKEKRTENGNGEHLYWSKGDGGAAMRRLDV